MNRLAWRLAIVWMGLLKSWNFRLGTLKAENRLATHDDQKKGELIGFLAVLVNDPRHVFRK